MRLAVDEVLAACGTAAVVVRRGQDVLLQRAVGSTADGREFTAATPVFLYSAVKPMAALCVLVAAADGALDLDSPVAEAWPAFAAHGKGEVTIAQVLAHGAALPGWRRSMTIEDLADRREAAEELASSAPWWPLGEAGEHALSYGHLLDAVLWHATGHDIAWWWEVAREATGVPIDLTVGDREPAPLVDPGGRWRDAWRILGGGLGELLAGADQLLDVAVVNSRPVRELVAPAVTGYAAAEDLAAFWAWWAGPHSTRRLGGDRHRQPLMEDRGGGGAWGLGPLFAPDGSYGLAGVGGCVGWYGPELDLAIGITTPVVGPLERVEPVVAAVEALRA